MGRSEITCYPAIRYPTEQTTSDTLALISESLAAWDGTADVCVENENAESNRFGVELTKYGIFAGVSRTVSTKQTVRISIPKTRF